MTGPPGVILKPNKQRCWTLTLSENTINFIRSPQNGACPAPGSNTVPNNGASGSITSYTKVDKKSEIPAKYQANCDKAQTTTALPDNFIGVGGPADYDGFTWLTPYSIGFSESGGGTLTEPVLSLKCVTNAVDKTAGTPPVISWELSQGNTACSIVEMKPLIGAVKVKDGSTCTNAAGATAVFHPLNFINLPPGGVETATEEKPVPKEVKTVDVVKYDVGLTPPTAYSADDFANPCITTMLRAMIAKTLPDSTVDDIILTSINVNSLTIYLNQDSPSNKFSAPPSFCPSVSFRRLREERMLPGATINVGVQAVVPPTMTPANFQTAVQNVPQTNLAGFVASAPSNIAPGSAVLAVPIVFPPRVNPYVPDPLIVFFHSIPRFALVGDGVPTNTFSTDLIYFQGALFPAGGIFALAILSLIIYTLAYICGCCACQCCKCRRKRNPKDYETGCKKRFGPSKAFGLFALLNVALILSVIGYLGHFSRGLENMVGALDDFTGVLKTASTTMLSISTSCTAAAGNANTAHTTCTTTSPNCANAVTTILDAANNGASTAGTTASSVGAILHDLAKTLEDTRSQIDVEAIKGQITMAGYAILGILCFVLTVFSISVCKNRLVSCIFKILAPINIILVFLVILLSGAFYAFGIIGSDVCAAPADTLITLVSSVGATGMPAETLTYYLTCGPDPATAPAGAVKLIDDNTATIGGAVQQLHDLDTQMQANPSNNAWSVISGTNDVHNLYLNMDAAKTSLVSLGDDTLACKSIDPILSKLFDSLCNDGFATMIGIFRILIAASVLLIIQLGIGVDLCCFHPGDSSRWLSEEEIAAQKSVEVSSSKPTTVHVGDAKFDGANPMMGVPKAGHGTTV